MGIETSIHTNKYTHTISQTAIAYRDTLNTYMNPSHSTIHPTQNFNSLEINNNIYLKRRHAKMYAD